MEMKQHLFRSAALLCSMGLLVGYVYERTGRAARIANAARKAPAAETSGPSLPVPELDTRSVDDRCDEELSDIEKFFMLSGSKSGVVYDAPLTESEDEAAGRSAAND